MFFSSLLLGRVHIAKRNGRFNGVKRRKMQTCIHLDLYGPFIRHENTGDQTSGAGAVDSRRIRQSVPASVRPSANAGDLAFHGGQVDLSRPAGDDPVAALQITERGQFPVDRCAIKFLSAAGLKVPTILFFMLHQRMCFRSS